MPNNKLNWFYVLVGAAIVVALTMLWLAVLLVAKLTRA